jgi:iron complex transport system ATP-binding protein
VLELCDAGFAFTGSDWVFRDVSFVVPPGTATVVLGRNGRGKTTLVRCAAGLLTPVEGVVRRDEPAGFVPQSHGSVFAYTVTDMVLMGRARHVGRFAAPGRRDVAVARVAIDRVGIGALANRTFPTLSGGEQQLVLIARALAGESGLLVLDEPASGLDLRNQSLVIALLGDLVAQGVAVLLTTHEPDHALHLASQVVLMDSVTDGGLGPQCGPSHEMLTDERLSRLYGIDVSTVTYTRDGVSRRSVVTGYGPGAGPAAVSPAPPRRPSTPRRR